MIVRQTHRAFASWGNATTRLPLAPDSERTDLSGDNSVARQRGLVCNTFNDEQRSDGLFNRSIRRPEARGRRKART